MNESPQEKKIRSYQNDRRNAYGENDKSSRKAIRFRKAWVNRSYRNAVNQRLRPTRGTDDDTAVDDVVAGVTRTRWKKQRDLRLAEMLKRKERLGGGEVELSPLREEAERRSRRSRSARVRRGD